MADVNCPYCDAEIDICHDDGFGMEEDETHQYECHECLKYFVFTTSISVYHEAEKADCLNDGKHDWKPTVTSPIQYTRMRCSMCDEKREPTEEEMAKILSKKR